MPTSFDNSWTALLKPEKSVHYFNMPYPPLDIHTDNYSKINALWLAELSRLAYNPLKTIRQQALAKVNAQEIGYFEHKKTAAMLIQSPQGAILAFRGSVSLQDWIYNLKTYPTPCPTGGKVHCGFQEALTNIWSRVEQALERLPEPCFYTGHSLGGALALLAASHRPPHSLYTFGAPHVGNADFGKTLTCACYRVVNQQDVVAKVPPVSLFALQPLGELQAIVAYPPADFRKWYHPPKYLSDHAPVNYVAHLERAL